VQDRTYPNVSAALKDQTNGKAEGICLREKRLKRLTSMKMIALIVILILFSLSVAPALGEMTDYEKGVANGLKIGLFMGELYGKAQYAANAAREFNGYLDRFDAFLLASFGANQTLIDSFSLEPIPVSSPVSVGGVPQPDASGRIYGYPADAYYTAVGAVPGSVPQNPHDGMGGI
jgi:hypothetical protein